MKNYEEMTREELIKALKELSSEKNIKQSAYEDTLHRLETHQIEVEAQNSELQESRRELEESRNRYVLLYDFAPVGYCTLDEKGIIREINLTGATMLGVEREKLPGMPFSAFVSKGDIEKFFSHLKKCKEHIEKVSTELCLKEKNGQTTWIEVLSSSIKGSEELMFQTVITEITERRQAEERIVWLSSFPEMNPSPVIEFDINGDICYANTAAKRLFTDLERLTNKHPYLNMSEELAGLQSQKSRCREVQIEVVDNIGIGVSVISRNMEILSLNNQMKKWFPDIDLSDKPICHKVFNNPPKEETCSYCPTIKSLKYGKVYEDITETPVGSQIRNYKIISSPLKNKEGEIVAAIEMVEDITERLQTEKILKDYTIHLEEMVKERTKELKDAHEKLIRQEKLAIMGQLAGSVGHELRNPLGVINNAVYFLKMVMADSEEKVREYLDIISSEVGKSEKIISDLLNFSRTNPVSMKEHVKVLQLLSGILKKQIPPEKIKVINRITSEDLCVFADQRHIEQILENLIINAYQAMPQGGELIIDEKREKDIVKISITDTGCGISGENINKIFEPLFTTKARGIGLGLSVSKKLLEINGGKLEVESTEGKGSTFTLMLNEVV